MKKTLFIILLLLLLLSFSGYSNNGVKDLSMIELYHHRENTLSLDHDYIFYRNGKIYLVSFEPILYKGFGTDFTGNRNVYLYCKDTSKTANDEWIKANDLPLFTGYNYPKTNDFKDFYSNITNDLKNIGCGIVIVDNTAIITIFVMTCNNNVTSGLINKYYVKLIR